MSAAVEHVVKVNRSTTVSDLRRGLSRCPKDARVTVSYNDIKAAWTVPVEPEPTATS